jgi:hypothetical protein
MPETSQIRSEKGVESKWQEERGDGMQPSAASKTRRCRQTLGLTVVDDRLKRQLDQ